MCLAVPGKLLSTEGKDPLERCGRVSFGGVVKEVSLACAPEARPGDFVLVHVGVAIGVIDASEAERTFMYLRAIGDLGDLEAESAPSLGPP